MADEFKTHKLNARGLAACSQIGELFSRLLADDAEYLKPDYGFPPPTAGRDRALLVTKLQEACHVAKRAAASLPENQADFAPHNMVTDQDETYCNRRLPKGHASGNGICGVSSGSTEAHAPCRAGALFP